MLRKAVFVVAVMLGGLLSAVLQPAVAGAEEIRRITLPVDPDRAEEVRWSDTWGAPRSGGRSHKGVDMLGPQMVPLVAARDGVITWLRHSSTRGNILYLTDDEGWTYIYVHINNDTPGTDDGANNYDQAFGPGIKKGVRVTEGQVIAYMGDSGNAEWTASHVHFEVVNPAGQNLNPTPIVDAALANLRAGGTPAPAAPPPPATPEPTPTPAPAPPVARTGSLSLGSYESVPELTNAVYRELEGRPARASERRGFSASVSASGTALALSDQLGTDTNVAQIERLYRTYLQRTPDTDGLRYWVNIRSQGYSITQIATFFSQSVEFQSRYGSQTDAEFLEQLYHEALGRPSDKPGKDYWLGILDSGRLTRGTIGIYFSESKELKRSSAVRSELLMLSLIFKDRVQTPQELAQWTALRKTTSLAAAVDQVFLAG